MNVMAVPLLPARPVRPTLTEQSDHIQKKDSGHGYIRRPLSLPHPPVHIVLVMVRDVVVEHQHKVLDVQASGSNACCNQDATDFALEIRDCALPVALILATMQAQAWVPILEEVAKQSVAFLLQIER